MKILMLVALFAFNAKAQTPIIRIDGSSTVFPITEAVSEEFQTSKRGAVRVTVGISGTGGGFKKFCRGEIDVQNASRPISSSEIDACKKSNIKFVEVPVAYDATVVAVNPKNTFLSEISVADLKKIWEPAAQGKITHWSQINAKWPNEKIKLYGAGADSGTFDYFTEAVMGKAKSSRGDYTASEDDNTLVTGIANDKFALGYLPLAYFEENKARLKALAIIGKPGSKAVLPSKTTVENSTYQPLSRPIFIYLRESSLARPEVREFANFYIKNAAALVPSVKYVALPAKAYQLAEENIKKNKVGTVFAGHSEVGMSIEELLKREGKM